MFDSSSFLWIVLPLFFLGYGVYLIYKTDNWGKEVFSIDISARGYVKIVWYLLLVFNIVNLGYDFYAGALQLTNFIKYIAFIITSIIFIYFNNHLKFKITEKGIVMGERLLHWNRFKNYSWKDNKLIFHKTIKGLTEEIELDVSKDEKEKINRFLKKQIN